MAESRKKSPRKISRRTPRKIPRWKEAEIHFATTFGGYLTVDSGRKHNDGDVLHPKFAIEVKMWPSFWKFAQKFDAIEQIAKRMKKIPLLCLQIPRSGGRNDYFIVMKEQDWFLLYDSILSNQ